MLSVLTVNMWLPFKCFLGKGLQFARFVLAYCKLTLYFSDLVLLVVFAGRALVAHYRATSATSTGEVKLMVSRKNLSRNRCKQLQIYCNFFGLNQETSCDLMALSHCLNVSHGHSGWLLLCHFEFDSLSCSLEPAHSEIVCKD